MAHSGLSTRDSKEVPPSRAAVNAVRADVQLSTNRAGFGVARVAIRGRLDPREGASTVVRRAMVSLRWVLTALLLVVPPSVLLEACEINE